MNRIIRQLTPDDIVDYITVRARITEAGDGKYFSSSFKREAYFTEADFRNWLKPSQEHCTIGIFNGDKIVGLVTVLMFCKPEERTFEYETIWLEPHLRRGGHIRAALEIAQEWAEDHGYNRLVSMIRADNDRALEIRREQGAVFSHMVRDVVWSDGSTANEYYFTTDLLMANVPSQTVGNARVLKIA